MKIDFSQPAPHVRTLNEAQTLIDTLWLLVRDQAALMNGRPKRLANSSNASRCWKKS